MLQNDIKIRVRGGVGWCCPCHFFDIPVLYKKKICTVGIVVIS